MLKKILTTMVFVFTLFTMLPTINANDVWFDTENHGDFSWVWYVDTDSIEKMYGNRFNTVKFVVKLNKKDNNTHKEEGWNLWRYRVYTKSDDPYNYYVAGTQKGHNANKVIPISKNDYHMDRIMRIVAQYDEWAATMLP